MVNNFNEEEVLQMIGEAENIIEDLKKMKKYGDWRKKLSDIKCSFLLKEYYNNIGEIEQYAEKKDEKMTHLLYHLMNQHSISFLEMSKKLKESEEEKLTATEEKGGCNIDKLKLSFDKSVFLAEKLENNFGSYVWYSNMKLPETFLSSKHTKDYYSDFSKRFIEGKDKIKVRRLHLFYHDMINSEKEKDKDSVKKMFTILLIEYLMRIESKVVVIKDYKKEDINKHFFKFNKKIDDCRVYLLDFALFHSRNFENPTIYGNYNSLFADFCFEELEGEKENFDNQKVYHIDDYNIFHILKSYYLSLWDKQDYIIYLNKRNELIKSKQIDETIKLYEENIFVYDFFDFWKEYFDRKELKDIFDITLFLDIYPWESYKNKYPINFTEKENEYKNNNNNSQCHCEDDVYSGTIQSIFETFHTQLEKVPLHIRKNFRKSFDNLLKFYFLRDVKDVREKKVNIIDDISEIYDIEKNTLITLFNKLNSLKKNDVKNIFEKLCSTDFNILINLLNTQK